MPSCLADFEAVLLPPNEQRLIEAAYYRGQLYLQLGELTKAQADFDRVIAENPRFRPVYPLRARIRIALGNNALARQDLDAYLAHGQPLAPRSGEAYGQRGRLLHLLYVELPLDQRQKPFGQALASQAVTELKEAVDLGARQAEVFDAAWARCWNSWGWRTRPSPPTAVLWSWLLGMSEC